MVRRRRSKAAAHLVDGVRSPETAASAARWDTLATFEVIWDWRLVAAAMASARADQPPDAPAGHGVGLGHAVDHDPAVPQLRAPHGQRVELGAVVEQVLVDLVGQDPDAALGRPGADGVDLLGA